MPLHSTDARVVVVTGAAGFLGSALTLELARDHHVIALDIRPPSQALRDAAPTVAWHQVDICDDAALTSIFQKTRQRLGQVDYVLHFAAFYHFDTDWHPEYQRTNIDGTATMLRVAEAAGAVRFLFASSMVAMLPPSPGEALTERSPTSDYIPYGKSKSLGEELVRKNTERLPATVLRIAGVFSDWCELPPLDSLIRLWAGNSPLSRVIVGRGETGIPYLHCDDLVQLVRRCLERNATMAPHEVFLASQAGAISHQELFQQMHSVCSGGSQVRPVFLPSAAALVGLHLRRMVGLLTRDPPYERPWMLKYLDQPWVADTTNTRDKLNWECRTDRHLYDRLPTLIRRFREERPAWDQRSLARAQTRYAYEPERGDEGAEGTSGAESSGATPSRP